MKLPNNVPFLDSSPIIDEAKKTSHPLTWKSLLLFLLLFFAATLVAGIAPGLYVALRASDVFASFDFNALFSMTEAEQDAAIRALYEAMEERVTQLQADPVFLLLTLCGTVFTLAAFVFYARTVEKRSYASLGIIRRGFMREYVRGLFVGALLFGSVVLIAHLTGAIRVTGMNTARTTILFVPLFFIGYIFQGAEEELVFRGWFFTSVARRRTIPVAMILSAILFAVCHIGNPGYGVLAFANITLFGLFAALWFLRSESLAGICAVHTMWNFMQGNVFACSVSGLPTAPSLFQTVVNEDAPLLNGGTFGPEGGIVVTFVLVIAILLVLFVPKKESSGQ